jgi:hypothetical protein
MVHELFLTKCDLEHLRKLARVDIKENEASDVAESRAEKEEARQQQGRAQEI